MRWIFWLLAALLVAGGLYLTRKFKAIATYSGIGGFRITPGGIAYMLGVLLIIFGVNFFVVGTLFFL